MYNILHLLDCIRSIRYLHVSCTKLEYVKTAFTKTPRSWSEEVSIQMKACVEPLNQHIKINDGNVLLLSRENVQQMSFMIKELFFCLLAGRTIMVVI